MMNSKKQKNKVLIFSIYSLSVAIIWSLFIGLIFHISRFFDSPLESGYDYLGFIGSIISGLLTLVGVLITIKFESKKNTERLSVEYKPILEIKQEDPRIEIKGDVTKLIFAIRNIGRGEALYVNPIVTNTKYIHCIDGISMNVSDKNNENDYYNLVMTYETKHEEEIKKELGNKMNVLIKYKDLTESKILISIHIIEFTEMFSIVEKVYNSNI